jgi:hypothetical protein
LGDKNFLFEKKTTFFSLQYARKSRLFLVWFVFQYVHPKIMRENVFFYFCSSVLGENKQRRTYFAQDFFLTMAFHFSILFAKRKILKYLTIQNLWSERDKNKLKTISMARVVTGDVKFT